MKHKINIKTQNYELPVLTREGRFFARYSQKGLAELNFPAGQASTSETNGRYGGVGVKIRRWHRATESAVREILAGQEPGKLPPLDFSAGTEFQKSVWRELRRISAGKAKSYGDIARAIGRPRAVRAVGGACGKNPIPLLVPCHRVLAANKKIGGFSGGLHWKRKLLEREGVVFN